VIAIKANQKKLFVQLQRCSYSQVSLSCHEQQETTRGRVTTRQVAVFAPPQGISSDWSGLNTFVRVERFGTRAGQPYQQTAYYIRSLRAKAATFAQGIRGHWLIENQLHWGGSAMSGFPDLWRLPFKDVVFGEDRSPISLSGAATNFSIVRSIVLNLFRKHGYSSLTQARRLVANDLHQLLFLLE
jgi:predicted transposase YbfD/YdcC